jgi:hypothetical protein
MVYRIDFKGDDMSEGKIFEMEGNVYFTGGNGITVRVPSSIYHQRMLAWVESRMVSPMVFVDANGCRCILTARAGGGDVEVELAPAIR